MLALQLVGDDVVLKGSVQLMIEVWQAHTGRRLALSSLISSGGSWGSSERGAASNNAVLSRAQLMVLILMLWPARHVLAPL